jgi:RNA polymerase sigma-70 factor (ECF subfamily)
MNRKKEFEQFYNDNLDKLYRFVFFRVGKDQNLAEDLISEIFMKVVENFDSYDVEKSRTAWLYTIAKNHLANYWRDKKDIQSLTEISEDDDVEDLEGSWFKTSVDKFKNQEENGSVYDILSTLAIEDREIVTFHYLYGYSYLEIAQMTNKTETAIKTTAYRAIKKLKGSFRLR